MQNIREPLAHAKGVGAAHSGTHHYITHKLTSVALILLGLWLVPQLLILSNLGFTHMAVTAWLQSPVNAILLTLFTLTACRHFYGHLEEVVLDYVRQHGARIVTLTALKFAAILLAFSTSYAIIFMSFVGTNSTGVL
jgi:succinate dehydrogenase / fumarate reductase membrane anchor subunit